jgi:hypothetical protein
MKIIATVRTFNESRHIDQYCQAYQFADDILIADGGSTDNTVDIASRYPKVQIKNYPVKVKLEDGTWRNPDGPHVQFLVDWATEIGGDWIIHQDCDQRPNKVLKMDVRDILSETNKDFVQVTQIFMWGQFRYFHDLSYQNGRWMQGLWAWRLSSGLKILNRMPHYVFSLDGEHYTDIDRTGREMNVLPPYCFLHFGWQTEEETLEHVIYYRRTGLIPDMKHPLEFGGKPVPVLEWMME